MQNNLGNCCLRGLLLAALRDEMMQCLENLSRMRRNFLTCCFNDASLEYTKNHTHSHAHINTLQLTSA
jgi:hypothetical protein